MPPEPTTGRIRRALKGEKESAQEESGPDHGHPGMRKSIAGLQKKVDRLEKELQELRDDLQEQRLLGLRVAELSDLVTGLIGAAARGPEEFDRALAEYSDDI